MGASCSAGPLIHQKAPLPDDSGFWVDYSGDGPWHTCDPTATMQPRMSKHGPAGSDTLATTMPKLLMMAAQKKGDKDIFFVERPVPPLDAEGKAPPALPKEQWQKWTYQEALRDTELAAKGFIKLGMMQYDSVNVWGFNAPEWHMSAYAANFAGGKVAGLYPTDMADTAAYKVVHSGGAVVVIEDRSKLDKLVKALNGRGDCTRLKAIVAYGFEPAQGETVEIKGVGPVSVMGWSSLLELGREAPANCLEERIARTEPGHCAALIYTSGTTGDPKAVMISHDNIIFESSCVAHVLGRSCGIGEEEERILSYLPLSHVAGMMVDITTPVCIAAMKEGFTSIYFARNYDLKVGTIKDRLQVARPTMFLGVPLVWEKIADKIRAIGAENRGAKKALGDWAKGLSLQHAVNIQLGGSGQAPMGLSVASAILNKVKENLGLDKCKYGFTGAAPIRVDTLEYFGSLGLHINEVYGMSECTGACTISTDQAHQWGSCGWEIPGCEVKAFIVDDADLNKKREAERSPGLDCTEERYMGELCYRGRHIMMGYMAQSDLGEAHVAEIKKKTAETIDKDGWLHSGDKGMITEAGMVKITGRYKELIIGAGGENIAPVPIEDCVKKACDGINEVMMVGDKQKYNIALITLKAVGANGEIPGTDQLDAGAKRLNPAVTTISGAINDPKWIEEVTKAINAANNNGKVCPNNSFKIQKFCILPTNFSEENNELTPTKKLKRTVAADSYKALIDRIYATEGTYIAYS